MLANQKISIAVHEIDGMLLCRPVERCRTLGLKAVNVVQAIVTDPHLKQVAQNDDSVSRRLAQIVLEGWRPQDAGLK